MSDQWRIFLSLVVVVSFFVLLFNRILPETADTLYVNGIVYTMDGGSSVAGAIAVRGDRIVGVGDQKELADRFESRAIIDLGGKAVFPGFIDAHAHFLSLGIARITVDLVGTRSEQDVARHVRQRAEQVGEGVWIRGRGWDQNDWPVKRFPNHSVLDRVAPKNPVYLTRVDGHAAWVNQVALDIAGVTKETPDPYGGKIIRDASGNPTGVLIDSAKALVSDMLPPLSEQEGDEAMEKAINECLRYGLTTVHDMGVDTADIQLYKKFIDAGKFPMRIYAAIGGAVGEPWNYFLESGPLTGYGNHRLSIRALKLYVDGALGSRGAALIDPYTDDPGNRGLTLTSEEDLQKAVDEALKGGFQVCTHAIGDRGNNIILNVYERALGRNPQDDHRLRVEHAQVVAPDDIPRFKQMGVVPSMQPTHCTSDMYWAEARLGSKRVRGAYAWRSLLETGVLIPGGSDFPVEDPNPLLGIYAGITRQDLNGLPRDADDVRKYFELAPEGLTDRAAFDGGWYVGERMTREEAIRSFTSWAAWAGFEEKLKGSLEEGKLADFVVLSADIMKIPANEIPRAGVEITVVGGKQVYLQSQPTP
jgi:hypothetical protein